MRDIRQASETPRLRTAGRLLKSLGLVLSLLLPVTGCASKPSANTPRVYGLPFGLTSDRETVLAFTLINGPLRARVMDYGATLLELQVPDRAGKPADVVLGFDKFTDYETKNAFFGSVVGRYGNRIAGGTFELDGVTRTLSKNDGPNTLHGGRRGFDKRRWEADPMRRPDGPAVKFTLVSQGGDQGFPGDVKASVTYTLRKDGLEIEYEATTTKPTVINLTNHTYWNLSGKPAQQTVQSHELIVDAEQFTPVGPGLIPTGDIVSVNGTAFDFRHGRPVGEASLVAGPGGLDQNLCLIGGITATPRRVAIVRDNGSGRVMDVETDQPGIQVVDTSFFNGQFIGKGGVRYARHAGLALETQHYPDSPNRPAFPSTVLRPGETYRSVTRYLFRTK